MLTEVVSPEVFRGTVPFVYARRGCFTLTGHAGLPTSSEITSSVQASSVASTHPTKGECETRSRRYVELRRCCGGQRHRSTRLAQSFGIGSPLR
jgi:hypothetical protein